MKTTPLSEPSQEASQDKPLPEALVEELMADDMLPEYDIDYSKARPNRFVQREASPKTIRLDADVAAVFTTEETVNTILRALIQAMPPATLAEPPQAEPLLGERHPLANVIGVFKDDPMLDAMMKHIREQRRRDEEDNDLAA